MTAAEYHRLNQETFEGLLEHYVERSYEPRRQRRYQRRLARLERRVPVGRLLEVGCNVGGFLYAARERGWRTVGLEPVSACAQWARRTHGLDVRCVPVERARLEPAHYDAVHAHAVLEHLTNPVAALRALARTLRPGGVAWIDTVNASSFTAARLGSGWKLVDPALHYCLWSPATLRRACGLAGLEVLALRSHGVRFRPNAAGRPSGLGRGLEELRKLPWSAAARCTLRGESVAVIARRPTREPVVQPLHAPAPVTQA
jgi:SAM-dependent methyltransferase